MNKKEIQQLKEKIKEFENQGVYIEISNALEFHTFIRKAKIISSNEKLIISNGDNQDFIIELFYLENIEIQGNNIFMSMSNDIEITLSY